MTAVCFCLYPYDLIRQSILWRTRSCDLIYADGWTDGWMDGWIDELVASLCAPAPHPLASSPAAAPPAPPLLVEAGFVLLDPIR